MILYTFRTTFAAEAAPLSMKYPRKVGSATRTMTFSRFHIITTLRKQTHVKTQDYTRELTRTLSTP